MKVSTLIARVIIEAARAAGAAAGQALAQYAIEQHRKQTKGRRP